VYDCRVDRLQVRATTATYCWRVWTMPVDNSRWSTPIFTKFFCTLRTAVNRSSSGGLAIRYLLSVVWMTSPLNAMARNR